MTIILDKGLNTLEAFDFDGLRSTEVKADKSVSGFEEMQLEMSALQDKLNGLSAIIDEKDLTVDLKKSHGSNISRRTSTSRRSTSRQSSRDIVEAEREI